MLCNKCQVDRRETEFSIKYYKKDWTPTRRLTCKICRDTVNKNKKHIAKNKETPQTRFVNKCHVRIHTFCKRYPDKIPEIIEHPTTHDRFDIIKKQDWRCAITGLVLWDNFDIDHIIPLSVWWAHAIYNIQLLTKEAHKAKTKQEISALRKGKKKIDTSDLF